MKKLALLATAAWVLPSDLLYAKMEPGIQLYTVRDMMGKDVKSTLSMLSSIGYKQLEAAGYGNRQYYGFAPAEFKKILNGMGLAMPSGHYTTGRVNDFGVMTSKWEEAVEDAAEVGQQYMVCAFLFPEERKTLDQYKELMDLLNTCGETCKKAGIQFAYHNHDFEFQEIEGEIPFNLMLSQTDPDLVKMELDLYWTVKAGYNPVELFEKSPGRYPLWHVKDMDTEGNFAAVGTGTIDFKPIFKASKKAGLKQYFVEQDRINGDVKETITTSYKNVVNLY
jgi:sugar phosphate isomerase/epimerase